MINHSKLSVVVPCYNEEKNIPLIFGRFKKALSHYNFSAGEVEIILVDNGSRDESSSVFRKCLEKYSGGFFKLVKIKVNRGYGHGILSGLKESSGNILSWTHADLQTDPKDVFQAYKLFLETSKKFGHYNFIIKGKRIKRKLGETLFTFGMSAISSLILGKILFDINAQPKLFHRDFYNRLENPPLDFSLDLYLLYFAKKNLFPILTLDVLFKNRIHGDSNWSFSFSSKVKTIKRTISYIFKLRQDLKGI